jgi:hypothetical protein
VLQTFWERPAMPCSFLAVSSHSLSFENLRKQYLNETKYNHNLSRPSTNFNSFPTEVIGVAPAQTENNDPVGLSPKASTANDRGAKGGFAPSGFTTDGLTTGCYMTGPEGSVQFFNKNLIVLQKKLKIFISTNTNFNFDEITCLNTDKILNNLWYKKQQTEGGAAGFVFPSGSSDLSSLRDQVTSKSKQEQVQRNFNNLTIQNVENKQHSGQIDPNGPSSTFKKPPLQLIQPRLMSGYFNPDSSFFNFHLVSQIFSIKIPGLNLVHTKPYTNSTDSKEPAMPILGLPKIDQSFSTATPAREGCYPWFQPMGPSGRPAMPCKQDKDSNQLTLQAINPELINPIGPTATGCYNAPWRKQKLTDKYTLSSKGNNTTPLDLDWFKQKPISPFQFTYIETPSRYVFEDSNQVEADFFGVYDDYEEELTQQGRRSREKSQQKHQPKTKKRGWISNNPLVNSLLFPFHTNNIKIEDLPQFTQSSKTQDVYIKNKKQLKKYIQLNFSYLNAFKDGLHEGLNSFGKTYSLFDENTDNTCVNKQKEIPLEKSFHQPSKALIGLTDQLYRAGYAYPFGKKSNSLKENLICLPQSRVPIPQLSLSSSKQADNVFLSTTQFDSLFYSYQIPLRTKLDWNNHFHNWKNRLSNWRAYNEVSRENPINIQQYDSLQAEYDELFAELISTRINRNSPEPTAPIPSGRLSVSQEYNKNLSFFNYQNFIYSLIDHSPYEHKLYSNLITQRSRPFRVNSDNLGLSSLNQIYQYLPYTEGQMLEYYSSQKQNGIQFGCASTVYGVNKTAPNIKHQMIYTVEPITIFSIGALFQFSFFFFTIVFLKYFYKLYGKELIQFILTASGWLKEADENSQKQLGLNELEQSVLIVKKTEKRLKNIAGIKSLLPEISIVLWFLRHAPKRLFWEIDYRLKINTAQTLKSRLRRAQKGRLCRALTSRLRRVQKGCLQRAALFGFNPPPLQGRLRRVLDGLTSRLGLVEFSKTNQTPLSLKNFVPKGILLIGPPGTGKTFLVQALAGESEVPALIQSAGFLVSDQQLGVTRLDYLLQQARKLAPCIVFIDEIDTLGATRELVLTNPVSENTIMDLIYNPSDSTPSYSQLNSKHQEKQSNTTNINDNFELSTNNFNFGQSEVTNRISSAIANQFISESEAQKNQLSLLTQFLIEMDGLKVQKQILFIGATNRASVLDPALTRPGRFEKVLQIDLPGKSKRIEILKLYSKTLGTNFSEKKDWVYLANQTAGLSAADLAAIMNQSSIKSILNNLYEQSSSWNLVPIIKNRGSIPTLKGRLSRAEKSTKHTLQTIEHGFNTIVNTNSVEKASPYKRQFKLPVNFLTNKNKISSFKQLV